MNQASLNLIPTNRERAAIVRLMGRLQDHLESLILGELVPGETEPRDKAMKPIVRKARKDWQAAEALVKRFSK